MIYIHLIPVCSPKRVERRLPRPGIKKDMIIYLKIKINYQRL